MIQCSWSSNSLVTWCKEPTHWETLMLGKIEGMRRGWQRMRWLDGITDSKDMNLSKLQEMVKDRGVWRAAVYGDAKSRTRLSNWQMTHVCLPTEDQVPRRQRFNYLLSAAIPGSSTGQGRRRGPGNTPRCRGTACPRAACVQADIGDPSHSKSLLGRFWRHIGSYLCPETRGDCFFRSVLEIKPSVFTKKLRKCPLLNQNSIFTGGTVVLHCYSSNFLLLSLLCNSLYITERVKHFKVFLIRGLVTLSVTLSPLFQTANTQVPIPSFYSCFQTHWPLT